MAGTSMTPLSTGLIQQYTSSSGILSSPAVLVGAVVLVLLVMR